jgi:hypothetical protein
MSYTVKVEPVSRVAPKNQNGNYLVEIFGPRKRVDHFQTRNLEDATEEAWQRFRSRQNSTARITSKITVCRIWQPLNGHGWRVTDSQNLTEQMFRRWDELWAKRSE